MRILVGAMLGLLDVMVLGTLALATAAGTPVGGQIIATTVFFNVFGALIWSAAGRD